MRLRPGMSVTEEFDEYGFLVRVTEETDGSTDDSDRCHNYSSQPSDEVAQRWEDALNCWHQNSDSSQQLRQLLRKGLPRSLRSRAWQLFLGTDTLKAQSAFSYQDKLSELQARLSDCGVSENSTEQDVRALNRLQEDPSRALPKDPPHSQEAVRGAREWVKTIRQITVDMSRSYPSHRLFMGGAADGKRRLFRILALYAAYNPTVGYCQGMAYIGGLLLMTLEEEEAAFWALVLLFERPKYLAGYYDSSMSRLQTHADVFVLMLKENLPDLAAHLDELGVHPLVYVTPWFMCLFTSLPCWDTVLAIADLFFLEGCNTIFRVALAIMEASAPELVAMSRVDQALPFLQHLPSRLMSLGHLLPLIWRTTVDQWEVELFLDMAHRGQTSKEEGTRRTRKRAAGSDEEDGETSQAAKKRKKDAETPAAPKLSLLGRIMNVFTPSRQPKTPLTHAHIGKNTPSDPHTAPPPTPMTRTSRKRKREGDENLDLSVSRPRIQGNGIELADFSRSTPTAKLFTNSPLIFADQRPTPQGGGVASPQLSQDKGPRRSVRIAKRRSTCRNSPRPLPSTSVLSPLSVRPLQDHVLTTKHPREHMAFRLFTTPTPARTHSKRVCRSSTPNGHVSSPLTLRNPEVELKPINFLCTMNK